MSTIDIVHPVATAGSKSQQAYSWLSDKIRTREFEPGHRLVLSTIADELDVSVVPVREAIRQLEAEGLVTYERNVGAKVTTFNREAYFESMEIVAVLEARATALSAPHVSADDLAAAADINAEMALVDVGAEPERFTRLNKEFHRCLFRSCPNERLTQLLYEQWARLEYHRVSTFRYIPQRAAESVQEHQKIIELIKVGVDPGYLEDVARKHRLRTAELYKHQLEENTHD